MAIPCSIWAMATTASFLCLIPNYLALLTNCLMIDPRFLASGKCFGGGTPSLLAYSISILLNPLISLSISSFETCLRSLLIDFMVLIQCLYTSYGGGKFLSNWHSILVGSQNSPGLDILSNLDGFLSSASSVSSSSSASPMLLAPL